MDGSICGMIISTMCRMYLPVTAFNLLDQNYSKRDLCRNRITLFLSAALLILLSIFVWQQYHRVPHNLDRLSSPMLRQDYPDCPAPPSCSPDVLKSQNEAKSLVNQGTKSLNDDSVNLDTKSLTDDPEFFKLDLVSNNKMVNHLSRKLKTNVAVIEETQRIHMNIFSKLLGKYKYAMLFNIAGFENKGDPAIGVGEITLLRRLNIELVFHLEDSRNTEEAVKYARYLSKSYSNETLVILCHGGGNLISYANQDVYRERILKLFIDHEVVMFPQSYWNASFTKKEHIERFKKSYAMHPRLTFCYRDQYSYDQGSKLFPKARPLLVPDMAFQIGKVERFMQPIHDIIWIQRPDAEAPHYKVPGSAKPPRVIVADWKSWKTPTEKRTIENDFLITANGMLFLLRGRVVITDRLHGHILSTLCGIPHVILDPVNHKVSHYRDTWTKGLENVEYATTPDEALNKARNMIKRLDKTLPKVLTYHNSTEYHKNLKLPNITNIG